MRNYFTLKNALKLKKRLGLSYEDIVSDTRRVDLVFKSEVGR